MTAHDWQTLLFAFAGAGFALGLFVWLEGRVQENSTMMLVLAAVAALATVVAAFVVK